MLEHEINLGALIAEKRKNAMLSRKELAKLCDYKNLEKGIRRIEEIENGRVIEQTLAKIMAILDISEADREEAKKKDIACEIERIKNLPPFKARLIMKVIPAFYVSITIPDGLSREELIDYSIERCKKENKLLCLMLDYNLRYFIKPNGVLFFSTKFEG